MSHLKNEFFIGKVEITTVDYRISVEIIETRRWCNNSRYCVINQSIVDAQPSDEIIQILMKSGGHAQRLLILGEIRNADVEFIPGKCYNTIDMFEVHRLYKVLNWWNNILKINKNINIRNISLQNIVYKKNGAHLL